MNNWDEKSEQMFQKLFTKKITVEERRRLRKKHDLDRSEVTADQSELTPWKKSISKNLAEAVIVVDSNGKASLC